MRISYPPARTTDAAVHLRGPSVPDPDRWLENDTSETADCIRTEQALGRLLPGRVEVQGREPRSGRRDHLDQRVRQGSLS